MDPKLIMKTAQERITKLDGRVAELEKIASEKDGQLQAALKKVAFYEREKKVDDVLNILIDEKRYFPPEQRQEKKAYLMDESTDLDSYLKIAGELNPREPGMFYEGTNTTTGSDNREDAFFTGMLNKLAQGLYGS